MPQVETYGTAVPGTIVASGSLITPGGDQGPAGATGPQGPASTPSTDAGNLIITGSDTKLYLPASQIQPTIWSVRQRSYNALAFSNCNFEVDQRVSGSISVSSKVNVDVFACDRVLIESFNTAAGTATWTVQQIPLAVVVPGTNFQITRSILRTTLTATQATLASTDHFGFWIFVEGSSARPLMSDVHSMIILCRSSVASLKFGLGLQDNSSAARQGLAKLCTLGAANTWTAIQLSNMPIFPSASFGTLPGIAAGNGYWIFISLVAGSGVVMSANDVWVATGATYCPIGMDNFASKAVNSTFELAFIQHESGSPSQLMDLDYPTNLERCQRFYATNYDTGVKPGTASQSGNVAPFYNINGTANWQGGSFYKRTLASVGTPIKIYNHITGALNSFRALGVDFTVSASYGNQDGFTGITTNTNGTGNAGFPYYVADTGY